MLFCIKNKWLYFTLIFAITIGCKKEETVTEAKPVGNLELNINYSVDDLSFMMDSILYQNEAKNKYSITKIHYYLSGITLVNLNNQELKIDGNYYLDAQLGKNKITLKNIELGNYLAIKFNIGIDPSYNITNKLGNNPEDINMAWPDEMGGGYHFLKLEGMYLDSLKTLKGFAMHLGNNNMLVNHNLLQTNITITKDSITTLVLKMNINEWFTRPYPYNFITNGNYTMGIDNLMQIIKNNGKDVFTIE